MGDAQSAQREGKKDEAAEEESGKVDDAQAEQCTEDKPFKNNVQICEINEKAGISIAEVNGLCEDEVAADAVLSPDEEISETEIPLEEEEEPPKVVERNEKESSNEVDVAEDVPLEMNEMDGKKNDINDGFRKFFSNIGLRLSIKRGSTDLLKDLPNETNKEEQCDEEPLEVVVKETQSEIPEQNNDANTAQGTHDNDSTTGPTMTDITPEDVLENAEEKATEAKEEAGSDDAGEQTPPEVEDTDQEAAPEDDLQDLPEQGEVVSPIKKFFTTGIFSGLRKKRKPAEEETNEKEMIDMGKKDGVEVTEETEEDQQLEKDQIDPGVEASADEIEHKENEHKQDILSTTSPEMTDEGKSSTTDPSTDIVPEPDTLNTHEKEKVPASPLKRLLSGSSFRKLSKKPRSRRSSDSRLSDSGEHATDQLMSSTESAENQKEEGLTQPSPEATGEEDSAWASFKKLLTPKKRRRASSLSNKEAETPAAVDKPKPSEGEQISDQSTDEDKKRKDSSVSWEAVLCGSGKKRSRKTSDSEDETPPNDKNDNKQDVSSKPSSGPPQESSKERKNSLVSSTRVRSDGEGPTTWITFRRLVTPKRKAKEEDENKDSVQSDSEVSQDESSFSIKKLLPGRKKRKSTEKQDHVSSDEADKDVPSGDEDSETPAVVPLSEFDTPESMVQIQTQAEIESHLLKGSDYEVPEDLQQLPEPVLPCEGLQNEGKTSEESEAENQVAPTSAKDKELDDDSEVISKHQQLSDITEEGIITETMATPASVNEEAGRDDTIAEDLMEMTSEAITAPEPASVTTLADETEMISAVSQLSTVSSKTSGNTTPVPAEYEVLETDALLHQVVETITATPEAVPISSSNTKSENIVSSVLHQIFKTFIKEDKGTPVLEIHTRSEASAITVGDAVEELEEVSELAATAQTESIPEVNDSKPTEFLPEALEKFKTAEVTVDEGHEVHPTQPDLPKSETSAEHVLEETVPGLSSQVEAPQVETENPNMEVASPELKEKTQCQNEAQVEPEKVDEHEMGAARAEVLPTNVEDTLKKTNAEEDIFMDAREITQSVDEGSVSLPFSEGTNEQVDTFKTEDRVPPTEESGEPVDSFTAEPTEKPEDLQTEQTRPINIEEPQQEMEISDEPESKKAPEDTAKDEQIKEPEVLEAAQAPVISLEDGSVQSLTEEVKLEDALAADELKEESVHLTKESFELLDVTKAEQVKEPEVFNTVQASPDTSLDNLLSPGKESPEDMPLSESVIDEGKQEAEASVQPDNVQELEELPSHKVNIGIESSTEDFFASVDEGSASLLTSEVTPEQLDDSKTEDRQEQEELQALQPPSIDSQIINLLPPENEITEDTPEAVVTDEPQKGTEVGVEAHEKLQESESVTENVEVAEVLPSEVEIGPRDSSCDEPAGTEGVEEHIVAVHSTGESLEPVESFTSEQVEEPDVFNTVQASPDTSMNNLLSPEEERPEDMPLSESVIDEGKQETEASVQPDNVQELEEFPSHKVNIGIESSTEDFFASVDEGSASLLTSEVTPEQLDDSKTEDIQEREELQTLQPPSIDSQISYLLPLEKEITEDISEAVITDELEKETEIKVEAQEKLQDSESVTERVEVAEVLPSEVEDTPTGSSCDEPVVTEGVEEHIAAVHSTGQCLEPMESLTSEQIKEPEELQTVQTLLPNTEEPHKKVEVVDEDVEIVNVQEPEVLPSEVKDVALETVIEKEEAVPTLELTQSIEGISAVIPPTEGSLKPLDLSITDVQVQEEPQTVQASSLDLETGRLLSVGKTTEDILVGETIVEEQQKETEVRADAPEKIEVEADTTDSGQEPEDVLSTKRDVVQESVSKEAVTILETEATDSSEGQRAPTTPSGPIPEPQNVSKTEDVQKGEVLNTEEGSPLDSEEGSLQPLEKEILDVTTVMDEPQVEIETKSEEPEVSPSDVEESVKEVRVEPLEQPQVEHVQEVEVLQSAVEDTEEETLMGKDAVPVLEATESIDVASETVPTTGESSESADLSTAEQIQVQEVCEQVETAEASLDSEVCSPPLARLQTDNITTLEITTDELKSPAVVRVEADTTEVIQEPEEQPSTVEDTDREALNEGDTIQAADVESIDGSIALLAEQSPELVGVAKIEDKQEPEEVTVEPEAESDSKASSLQPFENVMSEDILTAETVTDEPQKETEVMTEPERELPVEAITTEYVQELEETLSAVKDIDVNTSAEEGATNEEPVLTNRTDEAFETTPNISQSPETTDVSRTGDIEEPEVLKTVQELQQDSIEGELVLDKVIPEDKPAMKTIVDELQKETDVKVKLRETLPVEADTSGTEQEAQSDPKASSLTFENVISKDFPSVDSAIDKPQTDIKETIELVEELPAEVFKSEIQGPEKLPSYEEGLEQETQSKESTTTDILVATESIIECCSEVPVPEDSVGLVEVLKTEQVKVQGEIPTLEDSPLDSKVESYLPLEKELLEDEQAVETVVEELQKEICVNVEPQDRLSIEAETAEIVREPDALSSSVKNLIEGRPNEEEATIHVPCAEEGIDGVKATSPPTEESPESVYASAIEVVQEPKVLITTQELLLDSEVGNLLPLEKVISEDVPAVETVAVEPQEEREVRDEEPEVLPSGSQTAETVTDELTQEAEAKAEPLEQPCEAAQTENDQEVEQEDWTPEVAEATRSQDNVAFVNEESNNTPVPENTTIPEETKVPSVDDAVIIDKFKHELPQSAFHVIVEGEKESEDPSIETATLEHAIVPEVVTHFHKEASATILDVLPEKTSDGAEPVFDSDDFAEAAEQDSVVHMRHVSSVECEDDHKIQVQVVDISIKSIETIVDEVLEVEVTQMKEVIEVHSETVKEEDILSASPDTKEEIIQEDTQSTVEEVVKDNLPEIVSESAVVIVEQAVITQPDAVSEVPELTESKSDQKEPQEALNEREIEAPAVISEDTATSQQVTEDVEQILMLEEIKDEKVESATGVTAGEIKPLSEESDVKPAHEPEQSTQSTQGIVAKLSETGLVVPQNTGIVSSTGNFESPSSLSLEFKLSIQFGQAKAQPPQPPTTDRAEPIKKKDVSEVGVQAEVPLEPVEPMTLKQQAENQKNVDFAMVKDQPTDAAESVSSLASTARAVITTHPVQMNLSDLPHETFQLETTLPVSPPLTTEEDEPQMDVSEIGTQAVKSVEPETQRVESQKQAEITEVQEQLTEGIEPVLLQDSTEKALTEPELLDVAKHAAEPIEQILKEPASPPPEKGAEKLLEEFDDSSVGVDAGELNEPMTSINLPQKDETQIQTDQTDVHDQPIEIPEPEATLELTERAVTTTQPELIDNGTCASKTEELVAEEKSFTHLQNDGIRQLASEVSEAEPVKPADVCQRAESQIEQTEAKVDQTEIPEQVTHFYQETRAVIITQPVVWDLALCTVGTAEPVPNEPTSPLQISTVVEAFPEDVLQDEVVESVIQITQIAENKTELTKADDQAEPEGSSVSAGEVVITTHPVLLDIGLQENEKDIPDTVAPVSPLPITEEIESMRQTDVSEVGDKDVEVVEAAELTDQTQVAESQIEPVVVDVQPKEITELVLPLDSTEGALIVTQPELLDAAIHANETSDLESKAPTSLPSAIMESAEALSEVSNDGVQAVDDEEPIDPTQTDEEQKEIEPPEVDVLETKITEHEEEESAPEITERAVITTHPTLLEVCIHTAETVHPSANAPDSSTVTEDKTETLKKIELLESDILAEEAESTQEAESQKQSENPETSLQAEPEVYFDLTQIAVITTQPALLDDGLYTIKTVEVEEAEAEDKEINQVEKVTSSIQSTDQPVCQTEKEEAPSDACDQDTKVMKEHVQNTEEENDQDVWLDAEEGDYIQEETEMSFLEVEEHLESVAESMPEEEERFEEEVEIDPEVQTEEEESHQEEYKTGEVCEIESEGEGEDFAIALEHQEYATASVSTIEWD